MSLLLALLIVGVIICFASFFFVVANLIGVIRETNRYPFGPVNDRFERLAAGAAIFAVGQLVVIIGVIIFAVQVWSRAAQ